MRNHEMMNYGFKEATAFEGVMPKVAEKVGAVGASDVNVKMHGMEVKGMDALEVVDVQAAFGEEETPAEDEEGEVSSEPDFSKDEIILGADFAPVETVVIESGSKTLNLNGKTMTAPSFVDESDNSTNSYGLWVKGGEVTIDGEGEIVAQKAMYSMAVWANGGNVVINNGTFRNAGESCDLIYASNGGKVEIYGGEFIATPKGAEAGTGNDYSALNIKNSDREISSITVYGGRFYGFDPANNVSEPNPSEEWLESHPNGFVAEGYKSVQDGDWWEVVAK